jgi:hypothetical protein
MDLRNLRLRTWKDGIGFEEAIGIIGEKEGDFERASTSSFLRTQESNGTCPPKAYFEPPSKISCSDDFALTLEKNEFSKRMVYSFLEKLALAFKNSSVIPWLILEQDVLPSIDINSTTVKTPKDESRLFWILNRFPRVLSLFKTREDYSMYKGLLESQRKWLRKGHEWESLILSPLNPKRNFFFSSKG